VADSNLTQLTADIVSNYVGANRVSAEELPALIQTTYAALQGVATGASAQAVEPVKLAPAVPVKKSITPDYLISLEDGRKYKSLKRHLRTAYNMSPEEYRAKWNLPKDYPMVAPAYAASRSALAKSMGLGRGGAQARKVEPAPAVQPASLGRSLLARRALP
jgi:predicted transcriptional regulator